MTIHVASKSHPYDVHVSGNALDQLPEALGDAIRVALIHPATLADIGHHVAARVEGREVIRIEVPDAEAAKTPQVLARCWDELAAAGFTRNDLVIGIGGGTATDLAGFVAATWLRGVAYVSVPTSVLGMVDAAVGGKTGINLPAGKNLVGAFHEPRAVFCDLSVLTGLPQYEVRSGLAEVVKCGFIADPRILELVAADLADAADVTSIRFAELVRSAIAVKAEVVAADLTERTSQGDRVGRESLNYGHTLGHAVEARESFTMRHGEAISLGMVFMAEVSRRLLGLDDDLAGLHRELLGGLGLPLAYDPEAWPDLRARMSLDKKARGTSLRLVGLRAQGEPVIIVDPDEDVLRAAYESSIGSTQT